MGKQERKPTTPSRQPKTTPSRRGEKGKPLIERKGAKTGTRPKRVGS